MSLLAGDICPFRIMDEQDILWVDNNFSFGKFMPNLKTAKLSESEEMYLVTAVQLTEAGITEPIPLSQLAQALSIQPASVNQMVRKLADAGYVNYLPYKGVVLLPDGRHLANRVLRRRRLWELFLVKHLELSPTEADALACRLEHITPSNVAERMYQFLDRPSVSPLGLPIPPNNADVVIDPPQPLSLLTIGQHAEIIRLEMDPAGTAFLHAEGIRPGAAITVLAIAYQGAVLLQAGECQLTLLPAMTSNQPALRLSPSRAWTNPPSSPTVSRPSGGD